MLEADIEAHTDRIRDDGFTVIEHAASPTLVEGLKAALLRTEHDHDLGYAKTSFEGFKTVRINNLLTYDDIFWEVPLHENVLPVVERVLDRECLLSSFCSLVLGPGQEAQPIHEDTQLIPLPRPHIPITINAIWALSDFREDNGATRIVPGSHKFVSSPEYGKAYDAVIATMPAGSVMLFDSALWHGGGANNSDARRFAFSCAYCWGWMRQQENLQLGIPRETAVRFPRRLQELCGYSVYKGQFGHIDNHDPIELLGRDRGKRMVWEATDAQEGAGGAVDTLSVMAGHTNLSRPSTSLLQSGTEDVDARDKPGHDELTELARSLSPFEPQIRRHAPLALGFLAVARHGVAVPRQAPVVGAFGEPRKIWRAEQMRERPRDVIVDIAHEAEFAAALDHARHRSDRCVLNKAPLPVPPLWPGIGMDQIDPRQRTRRRPGQ